MVQKSSNFLTDKGAIAYLDSMPEGESFSISLEGYRFDKDAIVREIQGQTELGKIFKADIEVDLWRTLGVMLPDTQHDSEKVARSIRARAGRGVQLEKLDPSSATIDIPFKLR